MPAALLSEGFARLLQWVFLTVGVRLLGVGFGVVVQQIGEVMLHGRADDSYSLVRLGWRLDCRRSPPHRSDHQHVSRRAQSMPIGMQIAHSRSGTLDVMEGVGWSSEDPGPLDEVSETSSWAESVSSVPDTPYWRQYKGIAWPWRLNQRARAGCIRSMVFALAVIVVVLIVWLVIALA